MLMLEDEPDSVTQMCTSSHDTATGVSITPLSLIRKDNFVGSGLTSPDRTTFRSGIDEPTLLPIPQMDNEEEEDEQDDLAKRNLVKYDNV